MSNAELTKNTERITTAQKFFADKAALENKHGQSLIAWEQEQASLIANNTKLSYEQKLLAMDGLRKSVQERQRADMTNAVKIGGQIASYGEQMFADLATTMQNAGIKSREFAIGMKIMSAAQAGINSYLAFTQVLADATIWPSWLRLPLAGTILAAGLAKQAAIWSTPITAETGLSSYTVPDVRSNRLDSAPVMAQAGETVSVTPRGEDRSNVTSVSIQIGEAQLFKVIQRGINTGQININNKNVGRGVFANL